MKYNTYSNDFKLKVINEYMSSNMSVYACARKHGIRDRSTLLRWIKKYGYERKSLPKIDGSDNNKPVEDYKREIAELRTRISSLEQALEAARNEIQMRDTLIKNAEKKYSIRISNP